MIFVHKDALGFSSELSPATESTSETSPFNHALCVNAEVFPLEAFTLYSSGKPYNLKNKYQGKTSLQLCKIKVHNSQLYDIVTNK